MIEKLHIKNFKGIKDLDLEFKNLTVLMGPNNSGKSSVLHAFAFLSQITDRNSFDGSMAKLGSFQDIVFQKNPNGVIEISITVRLNDEEAKSVNEITADNAYNNLDFSLVIADISIKLGPNDIPRPSISLFTKNHELIGERIYRGGEEYFQRYNSLISNKQYPSSGANNLWDWSFSHGPSDAEFCSTIATIVKNIIRNRVLNQLYYLSLFRKVDVRLEQISSTEPKRVSPDGEDALALFLYAKVNQENQYNKMVHWIKEFNVSNVTSRLEGGNAKVTFRDEKLSVGVDATEIGGGSNQLFPLIVQSFASQPGSILMIEEPETSLHAAAQVKLPYLFSDLLTEGKQLIITTHSIFIPLALSRAIRDSANGLRVADVQLYEFNKGKKGTEKTLLHLDKRGNIKNWISEVKRVEDELYKDWANSLPEDI